MAKHYSVSSMVQESLIEKLLVSEYCINFRKNPQIWKSNGCYGHPAATLLFSIIDTIGSYILGGPTRKHFDILNDKNYFNLNLPVKDIDLIYKKYRSFQTHNSALGLNCTIDIDNNNHLVYLNLKGDPYLYLLPLLNLSKSVSIKFLKNIDRTVLESNQLRKIIES